MATFFEVVTAAVADIAEHGYDNDRRLAYWVSELRKAAESQLISEAELTMQLKRVLHGAYDRLIERGRILEHHPGVGRFSLVNIKPKLRPALDRHLIAAANLIKLNREQTIADTLKRFEGWATSIPAGGSKLVAKGEVKNNVRKELASLPFREKRVLIDQANKLFCSVNAIIAADQGAIAGEWRSNYRQLGYDFRPEHRDRDSRYRGKDWVYLFRGSWAHKQGLVKAGRAGFTDEITQPSEEVFCLPGETRIPVAEGVEVAYRRWYEGQLAEIVTASGKTLRATPNHPVLTPHGWRAMQSLNEGDQIIEVADEVWDQAELYQTDRIPSIAQIFGAFVELGVSEVRRGELQQFHGDGADSDVDIVYADRPLAFGRQPDVMQSLDQLGLTVATAPTSVGGSLRRFGDGGFGAPPSFMSGSDEASATIGSLSGHPKDVGFATASQTYAHLLEASGDIETGFIEALRQSKNALSGLIRPARLVKVDRRQFAGQVFNLQTVSGAYIAEGVVTHNCRCFWNHLYSLSRLPEGMLTERGKKALAQTRSAA